MMKFFPLLILSLVLGNSSVFAQNTQQKQTESYAELLRKDLRAEKTSVVDQAMGLDASQKAKFWPIYEKYEGELKALFDKRFATIKKYADNFENMDDATADQIAGSAFNNQTERIALWKKYYAQVKTALGAKVAARFVQVESGLNNVIDLQLASSIPLMP